MKLLKHIGLGFRSKGKLDLRIALMGPRARALFLAFDSANRKREIWE